MGVGSSRGRVVGASPTAVHAHQPPKRGERRVAILSQCYEAIQSGKDVNGDCRVDVGLTKAWTRCLEVISDKCWWCRGPQHSQSHCLYCAHVNEVATSAGILVNLQLRRQEMMMKKKKVKD